MVSDFLTLLYIVSATGLSNAPEQVARLLFVLISETCQYLQQEESLVGNCSLHIFKLLKTGLCFLESAHPSVHVSNDLPCALFVSSNLASALQWMLLSYTVEEEG